MSGLIIMIDGSIIIVPWFKAGHRLKGSGLKAIYSVPAGGWMLDHNRLPDLLAYLESRNIGSRVVDPDEGPGDAA